MGNKYEKRNEISDERLAQMKEALLTAIDDSGHVISSEEDVFAAVNDILEDKIALFEMGILLNELDKLVESGEVARNRAGRYMTVKAMGMSCGIVQRHRKGFGFITPKDGGEDLYVSKEHMKCALNSDEVLYRILPYREGEHKAAVVEKILEHANKTVIGIYMPRSKKNNGDFSRKKYGTKGRKKEIRHFVLCEDEGIPNIYIDKSDACNAKPGDKVLAEITRYPDDSRKIYDSRGIYDSHRIYELKGKIIKVFGPSGSIDAEIHAVLSKYEINEDFAPETVFEAENIEDCKIDRPAAKRMAGRTDLRDRLLVTIDGEDARDYDDAVSVIRDRNNDENFILTVCIADVSEYVKEGSFLDAEALRRGCSVYFPTNVYPMLPHELSNGICSLNEGSDRLTLTVEAVIDKNGTIIDHNIYESVMCSHARLTYTEVSDYLENKKRSEKLSDDIAYMLKDMKQLAEILMKKRYEKGSIDFDIPEPAIKADSDGFVTDVRASERRIANKIIEEFMLAANKIVAEDFYWMDIPFVFRVHEKPSGQKIEELRRFVGSLGYLLKGSADDIHPREISELIKKAAGSPEEHIISIAALRSMMKAEYKTSCEGHFGLGFKYYCHFTSPIRRYPDLIIHRIIKETLHSVPSEERLRILAASCEEAARNSSARERASINAERDIEKYLMCTYMKKFEGRTFDGIINGMITAGMFVELENTIEGFVPVRTMRDDFFDFDSSKMRMVGEIRHCVYTIGDRVKVKIAKVEPESRLIDMYLV